MRIRHFVLASVLAVSACVPPSPPAAQQAPPPAPVVVTSPPLDRPAGEWIDWPLTPGDWVYRQDNRGSMALFGLANADALVTLRCDRARQRIYLARAGAGNGNIIVRTSSATKEFAGVQTVGMPYIAAEIMTRDAILDAMIFSRGRIAMEIAGHAPLVIPTWAEIGRVVEDCRV